MFKPIKGYSGKYHIDEFGNLISFCKSKEGIVKSTFLAHDGYFYVCLYNRKTGKYRPRPIHRLVVQTHQLNNTRMPKGLVTNHKDGNKWNNHVSNLELVTQQENVTHAYNHGLIGKNPTSQTDYATAQKIRSEYTKKRGEISKLAVKYKLSYCVVASLLSFKTYKRPRLERVERQ